MASSDLGKELECSVCLSIYTDPVMLTCGHNFCRECINRVLDTQRGSGGYSCPNCLQNFQLVPSLYRDITLRNILDNFRSVQSNQQKTGILCTYCIHAPVPAVKSCLQCDASLCDNHLKVHSKSPEHILMDPSSSLENRKCSLHKKILEYYCTEDATCICVSCSLAGDHRGHQVEILDEASKKKKNKMMHVYRELETKRKETGKEVQNLKERRRTIQEDATDMTKRVIGLFRDVRRQLEHLEKSVLSEISRQTERCSRSVTDLIHHLEFENDALSRKMRQIMERYNMMDPLTVLQKSDTGKGDGGDQERPNTQLHGEGFLDVAGISHTIHTGLYDILTQVHGRECIQEAVEILLDAKTAGNKIQVSDDRKTASRSHQDYPETPERFHCPQVLSSQSFPAGRHYWEVDVSGSECWAVGMCYPTMYRKGGVPSQIGGNTKSWALEMSDNWYSVTHGGNVIPLVDFTSIDRVGIYLDYEAGWISFYDLRPPIRHLYTFKTTFTEPLYAALCVDDGFVTICRGKHETLEQWFSPS